MGQTFSDAPGRKPLVFLGVAVVFLILLAVVSFKFRPFKNSFNVEEVVLSQELDGARQPLQVGNNIPYGARQVCLWLKYSSAREDSYVEVSWYYEEDMVLSERVGVNTRDGVRAFYLLKEEGTPLPVGNYKVTVATASKQWSEIIFYIEKK